MLLLSPQIPLLFMGDDHRSLQPFYFFADYDGDIAEAVRANRLGEAANFGGFPGGSSEADIPDPNDYDTFLRSKLDWREAETEGGREWATHLQYLIRLRREKIIPLLADAKGFAGKVVSAPERCIFIDWKFGGVTLQLRANFSTQHISLPNSPRDRLFPEDVVEGGRLDTNTVQIFIRNG